VQGVSTRSGRSGSGHGHDRYLQEPGEPAVRRNEGDWPYLWIDATYVKVRQNGRIVSVAVIFAVGVNSDGRREVLGMDIRPSEAETFWTAFLRKLARRGLRGVKLVVSDAHEGIRATVASTPVGSAAASISCVTRWPMPVRAAGASSPPSSPPRSPKTMPRPRRRSGARSPISRSQAAQARRLPRRGRDR
jgi:hypothetical protein